VFLSLPISTERLNSYRLAKGSLPIFFGCEGFEWYHLSCLAVRMFSFWNIVRAAVHESTSRITALFIIEIFSGSRFSMARSRSHFDVNLCGVKRTGIMLVKFNLDCRNDSWSSYLYALRIIRSKNDKETVLSRLPSLTGRRLVMTFDVKLWQLNVNLKPRWKKISSSWSLIPSAAIEWCYFQKWASKQRSLWRRSYFKNMHIFKRM
jgi:hypothetical protein